MKMTKTRPLTSEERALVENNLALAQYLFHRQWARLRHRADYGVDQSDLLSQAYYGLIRAALRYRDYGQENGYSEESIASGQFFGVFARKSINGQMLDYLRKLDHVHTLVRKDYKLLIENGLGTNKSQDELALAADLPIERVQKVIKLVHARPVNLEDSMIGSPDQTVGEQIHAVGGVESSALEASLREALVNCLDELPEETQVVVVLKYYVGMELPEIAEMLHETLTNVRRMHTEALVLVHEAFVSRVQEA